MTLPETWQKYLVDLVTANRAELEKRYQQVLRESLFDRRTSFRPNMVNRIATEEVEALTCFFSEAEFTAVPHGVKLHALGLTQGVLLQLGKETRQFFLAHVNEHHAQAVQAVLALSRNGYSGAYGNQ